MEAFYRGDSTGTHDAQQHESHHQHASPCPGCGQPRLLTRSTTYPTRIILVSKVLSDPFFVRLAQPIPLPVEHVGLVYPFLLGVVAAALGLRDEAVFRQHIRSSRGDYGYSIPHSGRKTVVPFII